MRFQKHPHCLNCGFKVENFNFCPECGQPNTDRRLTLWQFIRDFFDDYFTFDSRFFRSVGPLVVKPGHLTREYLDGRRFRYILPMRLYLFTTFLFFFILTAQSKMQHNNDYAPSKPTVTAAMVDSVANLLNGHSDTGEIPQELSAYLIEATKTARRETKAYDKTKTNVTVNGKPADSSDNWFTRFVETKARYLAGQGNDGARMFAREAVDQIPKIMFILLPVFALILKLIYIRHKYLFVEHLIFALHIHTLIFLLVLIAILFPQWYVITAMVLAIFIQLYRAMRKVYQQSIPKTLLKMFLLLNSYGFALLLATALLALLALALV